MLFSIDFYCVFRYCGEHFDTESGTVYLRARYYNPVTGRFISRDSYTGEHGDPLSLNLYTYCHNNPILGVDPSGHKVSFKKLINGWRSFWEKQGETRYEYNQELTSSYRAIGNEIQNIVNAAFQASAVEISGGLGIGGTIDIAENYRVQAQWVPFGERNRYTYDYMEVEGINSFNIGVGFGAYSVVMESCVIQKKQYNERVYAYGPQSHSYSVGVEMNGFNIAGFSSDDNSPTNTLTWGIEAYLGIGGGISFSFNLDRFLEACND